RDRLVAPLTMARFGEHPDAIDTEAAIPGLNAALTRTGSLSGAVADLLASTSGADEADAGVQSIRGGMTRLITALVDDLALLGAELRTDAPVTRISETETGWSVEVHSADSEEPEILFADAVI